MNEIWDMKYENEDAVILIVPPDGQEWHEVRPVVCKENLILDLRVFWYQFWDGFDQNFQNCQGKKSFLGLNKVRTCQQYLEPAQPPDPFSNTHFEQPFAPISEPLWAVQSDEAKQRNTPFEKKVGKVRISILCFMKIIRTKLENTALN